MWSTTNSPPPPTTPNKIKRGFTRSQARKKPHKTNTTQNKQNHNTTKPNLANATQPVFLFLVVVLFILFGVLCVFRGFVRFCPRVILTGVVWCGFPSLVTTSLWFVEEGRMGEVVLLCAVHRGCCQGR
jgi:hypothetical protein